MKMSKSLRRPQQLFALAMWVLSFLFAAMLIGLGGLVIADLPRVDEPISAEQFMDAGALDGLDSQLASIDGDLQSVAQELDDAAKAYRSANANYQSARAALDAWLAARSVTEEDVQNPEVLTRTRAVEALLVEERAALSVMEEVESRRTGLLRLRQDLLEQRNQLYETASPAEEAALRARELKVFAYRLAITLPLLLVAGYFVARKRGSSYWPLYRGFVIFSLFAFFVELVPYLPSYGGYVRYIVGVLLIAVAGHYLIGTMRTYLERKQAEENRSEGERRQTISYETALKKIGAGSCPGCDRSIEQHDGHIADFCVHCGIRLRCKCNTCATPNISFHHFCMECGSPMQEGEARTSTI